MDIKSITLFATVLVLVVLAITIGPFPTNDLYGHATAIPRMGLQRQQPASPSSPVAVIPPNRSTTPAPIIITASRTLCGDINGDGRITVADVQAISLISIGRAILRDPMKCADVQGDGRIDTLDALVLGQFLSGRAALRCPSTCGALPVGPPFVPIGVPIRLIPNSTIPIIGNCTETDGGNRPLREGSITTQPPLYYRDYCYLQTGLAEFYCTSGPIEVYRQDYNCTRGCTSGRCNP